MQRVSSQTVATLSNSGAKYIVHIHNRLEMVPFGDRFTRPLTALSEMGFERYETWDGEIGARVFQYMVTSSLSAAVTASQQGWIDVHPDTETSIKRAKKASASYRQTESDFDIPSNRMGIVPRPYQKAGVEALLERLQQGRALLADEVGLGKTLQALWVILKIPDIRSVLVICPANARINWKREAESCLYTGDKRFCVASPHTAHGYRFDSSSLQVITSSKDEPNARIVVINFSLVNKPVFEKVLERVWDLVIVDEIHRIKNSSAKWTQRMRMLKSKYRLGISATAIPSAEEGFSVLNWIDPTKFRNIRQFKANYIDKPMGNTFLHQDLRTIMVRREKKDVAKDLPPKIHLLSTRDAPAEVKKLIVSESKEASSFDYLYREAMKIAQAMKRTSSKQEKARLSDELKDAFSRSMKALGEEIKGKGHIASIRRETGVSKVPWVVEEAQQWMDENPKGGLAIGFWHRSVGEAIHKAIPGSKLLIGGMSQTKRDLMVDQFRAEEFPTLVISIPAATEAINLQTCSNVLIAEQPWRWQSQLQFDGRFHRIGSTAEVVTYKTLVYTGSIDQRVAQLVSLSQMSHEQVIEGV